MTSDTSLSPLSAKVIDYVETFSRLAQRAKQPDFDMEEWNDLAAMVDTDAFERVVANGETRDWRKDLQLRQQFVANCSIGFEIRRIAEADGVVYLDIVEHVTAKDASFSVNTLAVYEFNAAGKLRRNITYQQRDGG